MVEFRISECTVTERFDISCWVIRHNPTKLSVHFDPRLGEMEYHMAVAKLREAVEGYEPCGTSSKESTVANM